MNRRARSSYDREAMSITVDGEALHNLVAEAQRGNRPAADRLIREHDSWVRSVIYGTTGRVDLVDDIAQQVWIQAWQRLDSLNDPSRLRPWLYRIARHAAIDAGKARRRLSTRTGSLGPATEIKDERRSLSPLRTLIGGELQVTLAQAVESLPAIYREPFVLRHLEDWTYARIGETLDMPVETVETRLVRARRLLREMLKDKVAT